MLGMARNSSLYQQEQKKGWKLVGFDGMLAWIHCTCILSSWLVMSNEIDLICFKEKKGILKTKRISMWIWSSRLLLNFVYSM